jgi:hypothetical protein
LPSQNWHTPTPVSLYQKTLPALHASLGLLPVTALPAAVAAAAAAAWGCQVLVHLAALLDWLPVGQLLLLDHHHPHHHHHLHVHPHTRLQQQQQVKHQQTKQNEARTGLSRMS